MSAYVVENEVINRIVGFLHTKAMGSKHDLSWITRPIVQEGYLISQTDGARQLAQAMYKLNCQAVDYRYGENQHKEFSPAGFNYQHRFEGNIYQVIKSIRCWLYQCSEGPIDRDTEPLYRLMDDLSMHLCYHIVSNSAEYEKAKW